MVFSVISIIISILALTIERTIDYNQTCIIISFHVNGLQVVQKADKCAAINTLIRTDMAKLLNVHQSTVEMARPLYNLKGLAVTFYIYINDPNVKATELKKLFLENNDQDALSELFQTDWNLATPPSISNVKIEIKESRQQRHLSEMINNEHEHLAHNEIELAE